MPFEKETGLDKLYTSYSDLIDYVRNKGPFLIKELTSRLQMHGSPSNTEFLEDPSIKHIFLIRNPEDALVPRNYCSCVCFILMCPLSLLPH